MALDPAIITHMRAFSLSRCAQALLLVLVLALTSCSGGSTTAGAGGSGIGGTGITRVSGNVAQIVALMPQTAPREAGRSLLASLAGWISRPATAQTASLAGIRVSGGGRSTTTDVRGDFELVGVTPGEDFRLTFVVEGRPPAVLPVGAVAAGAQVRVRDVVVDTQRGVAQAAAIEIQQNPGGPGQGNAGQGNPGQGNAGQGNPGQGNAGQGNAGQGNPGQGNAGQGNAGQGNPGQGNPGQGNAGQGNPGQGNPGQGNAGQGNAGQGNAGQGNPGQGDPDQGN